MTSLDPAPPNDIHIKQSTDPVLSMITESSLRVCVDCHKFYADFPETRCYSCLFVFQNPSFVSEWKEKRFTTIEDDDIVEISKIKSSTLRTNVMENNIMALRDYWERQEQKKSEKVPTYYAKFKDFDRTIPTFCKGGIRSSEQQENGIHCGSFTWKDPSKKLLTKVALSELKQCPTPLYLRDMLRHFLGHNKALLLEAVHADELLHFFASKIPADQMFLFEHAIGSYIFDVWNVKYSSSTFLCYYKDLGELISIPSSIPRLFDLWNRCNSDLHYHFVY